MSIWKDPTAKQSPSPSPAPMPEMKEPARLDMPPSFAAEPARTPPPATRSEPEVMRKESTIAADITIEGKIDGAGSVRIHGKFKGDVNVQGDLTIEAGAKVTGGVHADKVVISGELEGNIESASRVELLTTGTVIGDVKAASMTVAAGARMRGQADFGWDDNKSGKSGKSNGGHSESGGNA
ncbi:bactofilin family protein [Arenimonas sp.]|uniref:bactofilin family protein n=1 Tax=Arenimonas sp. TaxID=1872635 RepID=UPI0039C8ADDA